MMSVTDVVAYTYQTELLCPPCTVAALRDDAERWVADEDSPHDQIELLAEFADIDLNDESSYDSDDFPKVVFADQIIIDDVNGQPVPEACNRCGERLL